MKPNISTFLFFTVFIYLFSFVSGSINIEFSGFTEGGNYIYYTNGNNLITELTCSASEADSRVSSISTTWFYKTENDEKINFDSNVLQFEDVATDLQWGETRNYFCKAKYKLNGQLQHKDSETIAVSIAYNTTITVSYESTTHIISIKNHNVILIPVMTENVQLSCDAEAAEWFYYPRNRMPQSSQNPLTLDVYTREFTTLFYCTNTNSTTPRRIVHKVRLHSIGSGIWLQQHNTYTKLTEKGIVTQTEDRTVVCVSSKDIQYAAWYFRGEVNEGEGELVNDMIEHNISQGFLKLILPTSLPTSRTGYYYCSTSEYTNYTNTRNREHSIRVLLQPIITTTEVYSTPIISLQLFYTPDYEIVFVGVDDVIVTCIVINDHNIELNVSLIDVIDGNLLKREISNEGRIQLDQRIESVRGILTYKCTAVTEIGIMEEEIITVQTEDIYTQEVINVQTDINPVTQELILQWETSHPLLANETFIIWLSRVNVSSEYEEIATTQNTEYSLSDLSYNYHYSIRVQVVSRLNTTHTDIYYIHTDRMISNSPVVVIITVTVIMMVLLFTAVSLVFVCLVGIRIRRKGKEHTYGYNKPVEGSALTLKESHHKEETFKEYITLSDFQNISNHQYQSGYDYEPMESVAVDDREYVPMEIVESRDYCQITEAENIQQKVTVDKLEIPLTKLKSHLDTLWENGMQGLVEEFDELQLNLMRDTQEHGNLANNLHINIDNRILPYDSSRVKLRGNFETNYINASFIPGHETPNEFIATHFPTDSNVDRFWSLIWEQRINSVVIVATREEVVTVRRRWPEARHAMIVVGLRVKLISVEETGRNVVCRRIGISLCNNPGQVREVMFVEYTDWPLNEYSITTMDIIDCVSVVRNRVVTRKDAPICVMCNTGCGRTGSVIAVYSMLDSIRDGRDDVSVFNCVNQMRKHRPFMVQTLNQYKMIYTSLLEIAYGNTRVNVNPANMSEDRIHSEFIELEYHCQKAFHRPCNVAKQFDTLSRSLPYDDTRVVIELPNNPHISNTYYNASYIKSIDCQTDNQFIAAVSPSDLTICQFLEIVYQHRCTLVISMGNCNAQNCTKYWELGDNTKYDSLQLSKLSTNLKNGMLISELKLKRLSTNKSHKFLHILYESCNEDLLSGKYDSFLTLLDRLLITNNKIETTLIHCNDGITGVLMCVYFAVEMKRDRVVDIFQACKYLRLHRQNMVHTHEQYLLCYEIVKVYMESRSVQNYENLASVAK